MLSRETARISGVLRSMPLHSFQGLSLAAIISFARRSIAPGILLMSISIDKDRIAHAISTSSASSVCGMSVGRSWLFIGVNIDAVCVAGFCFAIQRAMMSSLLGIFPVFSSWALLCEFTHSIENASKWASSGDLPPAAHTVFIAATRLKMVLGKQCSN